MLEQCSVRVCVGTVFSVCWNSVQCESVGWNSFQSKCEHGV